MLKEQIETLRKQLDKLATADAIARPIRLDTPHSSPQHRYNSTGVPKHSSHSNTSEQDIRTLLDTLSSASTPRLDHRRFYQAMRLTQQGETSRDIRALIDALSDCLAPLDLPSIRAYGAAPLTRTHDNPPISDDDGRSFRALLDRISAQRDKDFIADRFYTLFSPSSGDQSDWGNSNNPRSGPPEP